MPGQLIFTTIPCPCFSIHNEVLFIEIAFELLWKYFFFTRFFLNFQSWVCNEIEYGVLLKCKFQIISFQPNCGILKRQMPLLNYSCYVKALWLRLNNSLQFSTFLDYELTLNILRAQTKLVRTFKQERILQWFTKSNSNFDLQKQVWIWSWYIGFWSTI